MRNFGQCWFCIDTKMMQNCVQKNHFVENHATVAQDIDSFVETLGVLLINQTLNYVKCL